MPPPRILTATKKDLAPLSFPKVIPEKMVPDYLHSKNTNSLIKKFPTWDIPRMEPSAEMVTYKKILHETEMRLIKKRQDADKHKRDMDTQWKDLEEKERILRDNFIKFNKFVKENHEKRERAERKIAEEVALIEKRKEDIAELQQSYEYMFNIRRDMEKNIKNHKLYEDYLKNIVKVFPLFRSVDEIINRYEALQEARKELAERQESDLNALEAATNQMLKLTEEKSLVILGLNNVMAELQSRYENAKIKALQWEAAVAKIKHISLEKMKEIYEVRLLAWKIYLQMCKRKGIEPELEKEDVEGQLVFIKSTLLELKRITKIAKRRANREYSHIGSLSSKRN